VESVTISSQNFDCHGDIPIPYEMDNNVYPDAPCGAHTAATISAPIEATRGMSLPIEFARRVGKETFG
jgi:hypothetical protein